ncbi:probable UDP-glucosyl transferase 73B6 [Elaeis guineensis]|uniref:Glycosyltransferase n=1 Tax=Elaeis guineensis var. tenera TaxID=51953 RepID=A0A6I9Q8M3_ELAGV|nr:scopoletin glucosyltransferase [Elaeis guineensis]
MDRGKNHQLHICFFPFMAHGHMIPMMEIARLFATRGLKISIISTPVNVPQYSKFTERSKILGYQVDILVIKFPCVEAGLPEGCEHLDMALSGDLNRNFFTAAGMLGPQLEQLLKKHRPDGLVADMFFPWATDIAHSLGIPRIVFHGTGFFSLCAAECVRLYEPHKKVSSDTEPFVIPNFPGEIKLTRNQLPHFAKIEGHHFAQLHIDIKESELKSFGVLVNSFYELEPAYADHFRNVFGRKAWHVGPVFLCNSDFEDKANRGKEASIEVLECLKWLDSKKPNSVVYISFGSLARFTSSQLLEIAMGLEDSGQHFIWVVKQEGDGQEGKEEWLPEGFEERMEGKGLTIKGWVPQVLILEHVAVGGFLTHCGWNSALEGIAAGVPMVTWPVSAEQFYNEKLVTEILGVGVGVGIQQWVVVVGDCVKKEAVAKAVNHIMVGKEAEEMRTRARELGELARRAVEEGGSSHSELNALIEELRNKKI